MVSSQEQIHDVRQSIIELPDTFQYSCFHIEHNGQRLNDFTTLSEVEDLTEESELTLVEDPYTEKEARIHVVRVRELINAAGDRTDTLQGILSGLSLHDQITDVDAAKNDDEKGAAQTHALAGYDFQVAGDLKTLLPEPKETAPKCIRSISVSPWNPPPYHLRQQGHLLYLNISTLESEQFQVTAHVSGFYVNNSTNGRFDPFPKTTPKPQSAHSLLALVSKLSPGFEAAFVKLQDYNNAREPLATFQITNATPATPWMVPPPSSALTAHQSDLTRTQESYLISGVENTETLRDWNEEFQSTKEMAKETAQDRVFRERLTSKLFADYNDAAARGAVLVARGEVTPLNPTEEKDAQIFVYNNIFFSFGADGVGTFASEGGDEAARIATGKDVIGVKMVNQLDIDGLFTPGTVVVDYLGKRIVGQSIVPGIFKQRDPGENQIDYGAVDGKDVIAADEKFALAFEKLSKALKVKKHSVWDKDGKKFDLEGSVETKGLLGTDGRKYVLDLYRITPLDIAWMEENETAISSPEQAKEGSETAYPHRMTVLRPELVENYWKSKMRKWVNEQLAERRAAAKAAESATEEKAEPSAEKDAADGETEKPERAAESDNERIDISDFKFSLNPDAFSGQEPQTDEEKADWARDEEEVRAAAEFLRSSVMPELVKDLKDGEVGFPMDGQSLSRLLHKRGVNMRYLGKLATLAEGKRLEALKILSIQEMISRAFKHIVGKYLRYLPVPFTSVCIAHALNCLLGTGLNEKPDAEIDVALAALYSDADLSFKNMTPESLRHEVEIETMKRFRYILEENWSTEIKPVQLLREVSLKLGLQLEAKKFHFTKESLAAVPAPKAAPASKEIAGVQSVGKKSKKRSGKQSPAQVEKPKHAGPPQTFSAQDVLNIVPIIKEASPKSALAEEALEAGRISILQGQKKLGQELLLESLSLHEQIYGILHPEVARVYNTLSMLYYQLEEKDAAVELARKAVIVAERTLGVDSAETLLSYLNLGLFTHANGETRLALTYIKHALELWKVIYGPGHPDSITTINNAAVMLQHLKLYHESRLWFEASLDICEQIYGKQSVNAATLLFQLAQALALDQDSKGSVTRMKESYQIFLAELGAEDKNTKEAESWLDQLTQNAVAIAMHAAQNAKVRTSIKMTPGAALGQTVPQPQAGQTAEAAAGRAAPSNLTDVDSRSVEELLKFIEGTDQMKSGSSKKRKAGQSNPKRRVGAKN